MMRLKNKSSESSPGRRGRPRKRRFGAIWIALLLMSSPCRAWDYSLGQGTMDIMLPDMGDPSGTVLSSADEARLGEAFMREVRARITVVDEPQISAYLHTLGYRLASSGGGNTKGGTPDASRTRFTFFVVKDPAINAFAVPGGFIGVNTGLILTTESESELAAVLAHEIAHIDQHHVARAIQLADKMHPLAMAGMLAAILVGTQSSQAGQAAMTAVAAGTAQKQIDFTRAHEEEADRLGIGTLVAAGFDPRAMPSFFERLQTAHRYYSEPPEFLSTHPVTVSRIADSRNRAEQYPYRQYSDSLTYHLVRAHLTVMMEKDPRKSVEYFDDALRSGKYRNRTGARYGLTLASMAAGDWKRAKTGIRRLLKEEPDNLVFQARLADIELAAGRTRAAIRLYADAIELYPGNKLLTLGYARALLEGNRPEKVVALLDRREGALSRDSALQKLLANAFSRLGRAVEANAALAEHYYLEGDLDSAIRQLRIALNMPDEDYYRSSRIQARLEQFEEEQRLR
uniref:Putative beta-barrel assembly-enhancing protease n=1 Tax=Candidatus Kentrum eta TaxID=2126337 RepID=A0A450UGI8_9GAMM|nr:MAG: Putative Zn-dependent protease, contains TPR repeats [Candidatus Kentron sp. H]VFJ91639.1 MAG: Putative Zn-dependent protease, contains TPR repeats [Candidatus Kentron sp. H]VFJ98212.1 MAG: Putative Zn-dependent protease, contains TPR repeats [Candidatus Kentron sp. H]